MQLLYINLIFLVFSNAKLFGNFDDSIDLQFNVTVNVLNGFLSTYFSDRKHIAVGTFNNHAGSEHFHCDVIREIIAKNSDEFTLTFLNEIPRIKPIVLNDLTILIADEFDAFK